jgi:NADPH2:quinone reductase
LPRLIAKDGLCAVYGSAKPEFSLEFVPLIVSGAAIRFFIVYELEAKARRDAIARMNDFFARGLVRHTIAARFPLEDCAAAHEAVEGGRLMGNVVLTI